MEPKGRIDGDAGGIMAGSFWSRIAGRYDDDTRYLIGHDLVSSIQTALTEAVPHGDTIELGCGTGLITRAYAPRCRSVIATDVSAPMMKEAERALAALPNVTVRAAEATATGLPAESADAVVMGNLLHVVPDPAAVLAEARRLLRPGGVVVAVDVTSDGMSPGQLLASGWRLLRRWGFGSGRNDLDLATIRQLVVAAGFDVTEARLLTGRLMNAAFVRATKHA